MATNSVTASFGASKLVRTRALHQWDYGQVLKFAGLDLPDAYTVHFSNQGTQGTAKTMIGNADGVDIPDEYLTTGQTVYAWVYLHAGDADGETMYSVIIPVTQRPEPVEDEPTPVQQGMIDQAIAALNAGVEAAEDVVQAVQNMGVEAETLTPGSMATVEKSVDPDTGAVTLEFGIPQGEHGNDGISPSITITDITGGHRITITDANGTHTVDVLDGINGDAGRGIVSVQKTGTAGLVDTYTITYTDSTTSTFTVTNGQNGTDGISPTITVTDITGGHRVTITDATGPHSFDVMDGDSADAPVQDVQVAGTSVVTDGVANVPIMGNWRFGVAKIFTPTSASGIYVDADGNIDINAADYAIIKRGIATSRPAPIRYLPEAIYFGLAKLAGADMNNVTGETVGVYPEAQKSAISQMLNGSVVVSGTTPTITALPGIRYVCGECTTLDITLPASGIVDVVFESGSTPTVLTITPPTGQTVKWANGFDPTALDANITYEINIMDGLGVAATWT